MSEAMPYDEPLIATLQAALAIGTEHMVASTSAFWLDRADSLQLVCSGCVDAFAVECRDGVAVGARHHLFRIPAGGLLLGLARSPGRYGILAVPTPGTQLALVSTAATARLQASTHLTDVQRQAVVESLSRLVLAVSAGIVDELPPRQYRPLTDGDHGPIAPGTVLSGVVRLIWVRVESGVVQLYGRAGCLVPAGAMVPLGTRSWVKVVEGEAWLSARTSPGDDLTTLWADLRLWLDLMFDLATIEISASIRHEAERLTRKAAAAVASMHDALGRFVTVGEEPLAGAATAIDPANDDAEVALLRACQAVGEAAGIDFVAPGRFRKTQLMDRVTEIAIASVVRYRRVALRDDWWTTDSGPLLGFTTTDGMSRTPVALLPEAGSHYLLYDPATGRRERVTPALAAEIDGFAMAFFRVFPARQLTVLDLVRFATFDQGRDLLRLLAASGLIGLLGMTVPLVTGRLIDTVIPSADKSDVLALTSVLVATSIASALLGLARAISMLRVEGRMDNALQAAVWDRVLTLPAGFFRQFAAGDLALRINGINTLRHMLSGAVMSSILTGVFSLFTLILLFYYDAKLAFIALGLILFAVLVTLTTGYLKLRSEREYAALAGKLSGMVYQYLTGIVKLRVCAAEGRAFASWANQYTLLRGLMLRNARLANIEQTFYAGYGVLVNALIFAMIGAVLFSQTAPSLKTGEFIAFNAAFGVVFGALMELSQTFLGLLNLIPIYERIKPILDATPEVDTSRVTLDDLTGDIEVMKLSYAYGDGPAVLTDVSFHIRPGEFVAVVGPSGSGKSTLLRLLMGFERPAAGSVCYDNHNLLDLDVNALRRQLGVVLQSGQLMAGEIYDNIVGASSATLDEVWDAVRLCGLEEDINSMPMGLHTVISEGSSTLSGGQRQRILIARAVVGKPRILFFDEATSALDNRTQAIVSQSLEQLKATRVVIAHRLSTIVKADRILVLQDGRLVQSGKYDELIGQPGVFADLAKRQLG